MKKLTLDEAIEHAEDVAKHNENKAKCYRERDGYTYKYQAEDCEKCAAEHRQLAEWLKDYREMLNNVENEPLDWEELTQMIGKPVWIECALLYAPKGWHLICGIVGHIWTVDSQGNAHNFPEVAIGTVWNAYKKERR